MEKRKTNFAHIVETPTLLDYIYTHRSRNDISQNPCEFPCAWLQLQYSHLFISSFFPFNLSKVSVTKIITSFLVFLIIYPQIQLNLNAHTQDPPDTLISHQLKQIIFSLSYFNY